MKKKWGTKNIACFVQAHSQCTAANTDQLNYRNTNPNHWRNCFRKTNQTPFICRLKYSVVSVESFKWQPLCLCNGSFLSVFDLVKKNLPFRYSILYSAQFNYYPVPIFTYPFGSPLRLLSLFLFLLFKLIYWYFKYLLNIIVCFHTYFEYLVSSRYQSFLHSFIHLKILWQTKFIFLMTLLGFLQ